MVAGRRSGPQRSACAGGARCDLGAPVAALAPIVGDPVLLWFLPAYAVAMPASIYVVRGLEVRDTWAAAEWVRGYMAAAIVLVGRVTMP